MTMKFTQSNLLIRGGLIDMFFCFKLNSYGFGQFDSSFSKVFVLTELCFVCCLVFLVEPAAVLRFCFATAAVVLFFCH